MTITLSVVSTTGITVDPKRLYQILQDSETTVVSVGHRPSLLRYHQQVLQLTGRSQWQVSSVEDYLATSTEQNE